jgi:hypothetical protein
MAREVFGVIQLATENGYAFSNSRSNDLVIRTSYANQRMLISPNVTSNVQSVLTVTSGALDVAGAIRWYGCNVVGADGVLEPTRIADQSLITRMYLNESVTTEKIAEGNVTSTRLGSNLRLGGKTTMHGSVVPSVDAQFDLGSSNMRFQQVYAATLASSNVTATGLMTASNILTCNVTSSLRVVTSNLTATGLVTTCNVVTSNLTSSIKLDTSNLTATGLITTCNVVTSNQSCTIGLQTSNLSMSNASLVGRLTAVCPTGSTSTFLSSGATSVAWPSAAAFAAAAGNTAAGGFTAQASSALSTAWNAFDASDATAWTVSPGTLYQGGGAYAGTVSTAGYPGEWVDATLPRPVRPLSYRLKGTLSSWQVLGTVDDGMTWDLVDTNNATVNSAVTSTGATITVPYASSSAQVSGRAYNRFRLVVAAGHGGSTSYALDLMTSVAKTACVGAYALQRVSLTYIGAIVQLRRVSDNLSTDFFTDSSGVLTNGAGQTPAVWAPTGTLYVTVLYDQSGNANNATQNDTTQQPVYDGARGLIDFTTGNTRLELPDGTVPFGNMSYSVVVRHGVINNVNGAWLSSGVELNYQANTFRRSNTTSYRSSWQAADFDAAGYLANSTTTFTYNNSAKISVAYINGTIAGSSTRGNLTRNSSTANNYIGWSPSEGYWNGEMYHLLVFNTQISAADRGYAEALTTSGSGAPAISDFRINEVPVYVSFAGPEHTVEGNVTVANNVSVGQTLQTSNVVSGSVSTGKLIAIQSTSTSLVASDAVTSNLTASLSIVTSNIMSSNLSASLTVNTSNLTATGLVTTSNILTSNLTSSLRMDTSNLTATGVMTTSNILTSNLTSSLRVDTSNLTATGQITTCNVITSNIKSTLLVETSNVHSVCLSNSGDVSVTGVLKTVGTLSANSLTLSNPISSVWLATSNSCLGLGTSNPVSTIDVAGTGHFGGDVTVEGVLTVKSFLHVCSNLTVQSNLLVQSTATTCNLDSSNATVQQVLTACNLVASNARTVGTLTACNIVGSTLSLASDVYTLAPYPSALGAPPSGTFAGSNVGAAGFLADASSSQASAWNAFDACDLTEWASSINMYSADTGLYTGASTTGSVQGEWVQIAFRRPVRISAYCIKGSLAACTLVGSIDDGNVWDTINVQAAFSASVQTSTQTLELPGSATAAATRAYTCFRLVVTAAILGTTGISVKELQLFEVPVYARSSGPEQYVDGNITVSSNVAVGQTLQSCNIVTGAIYAGRIFMGATSSESLETRELVASNATVNSMTIVGAISASNVDTSNLTATLGVSTSNLTATGLITTSNIVTSNQSCILGLQTSNLSMSNATLVGRLTAACPTGSTSAFLSSSAVSVAWPSAAAFAAAAGNIAGGGFSAQASSSTSTAWNAFDASSATGWTVSPGTLYDSGSGAYTGTVGTGGYLGEWVDVILPRPVRPLSYHLQGAVSSWQVLGTVDDGMTWDLVDTNSEKVLSAVTTVGATITPPVASSSAQVSSRAYNRFRLVIATAQVAVTPAIYDFRINEVPVYASFLGPEHTVEGNVTVANNVSVGQTLQTCNAVAGSVTAGMLTATGLTTTCNVLTSNLTASQRVDTNNLTATGLLTTSNILTSNLTASERLDTGDLTATGLFTTCNVLTSNLTASQQLTASNLTVTGAVSFQGSLIASVLKASSAGQSILQGYRVGCNVTHPPADTPFSSAVPWSYASSGTGLTYTTETSWANETNSSPGSMFDGDSNTSFATPAVYDATNNAPSSLLVQTSTVEGATFLAPYIELRLTKSIVAEAYSLARGVAPAAVSASMRIEEVNGTSTASATASNIWVYTGNLPAGLAVVGTCFSVESLTTSGIYSELVTVTAARTPRSSTPATFITGLRFSRWAYSGISYVLSVWDNLPSVSSVPFPGPGLGGNAVAGTTATAMATTPNGTIVSWSVVMPIRSGSSLVKCLNEGSFISDIFRYSSSTGEYTGGQSLTPAYPGDYILMACGTPIALTSVKVRNAYNNQFRQIYITGSHDDGATWTLAATWVSAAYVSDEYDFVLPIPAGTPAYKRWAFICNKIYTNNYNQGLFVLREPGIKFNVAPWQPAFESAGGFSSSLTDASNVSTTSLFITRFLGYFVPTVSGVHAFRITANDLAILWLGDTALQPGTSNTVANALVKYHASNLPASVTSADVMLTQGTYYPMLVFYGNESSSGALNLDVKIPGASSFSTNLSPYVLSTSTGTATTEQLQSEISFLPPVYLEPYRVLNLRVGGGSDEVQMAPAEFALVGSSNAGRQWQLLDYRAQPPEAWSDTTISQLRVPCACNAPPLAPACDMFRLLLLRANGGTRVKLSDFRLHESTAEAITGLMTRVDVQGACTVGKDLVANRLQACTSVAAPLATLQALDVSGAATLRSSLQVASNIVLGNNAGAAPALAAQSRGTGRAHPPLDVATVGVVLSTLGANGALLYSTHTSGLTDAQDAFVTPGAPHTHRYNISTSWTTTAAAMLLDGDAATVLTTPVVFTAANGALASSATEVLTTGPVQGVTIELEVSPAIVVGSYRLSRYPAASARAAAQTPADWYLFGLPTDGSGTWVQLDARSGGTPSDWTPAADRIFSLSADGAGGPLCDRFRIVFVRANTSALSADAQYISLSDMRLYETCSMQTTLTVTQANVDGAIAASIMTASQRLDTSNLTATGLLITSNILTSNLNASERLETMNLTATGVISASNLAIGKSAPAVGYSLDILGDVNIEGRLLSNGQPLRLGGGGAAVSSTDASALPISILTAPGVVVPVLNPLRAVRIIKDENDRSVSLVGPGQLAATSSNVEVCVNGQRLTYLDINGVRDYSVTYNYDSNVYETTLTVALNFTPTAGDVLDVLAWPSGTYLTPNNTIELYNAPLRKTALHDPTRANPLTYSLSAVGELVASVSNVDVTVNGVRLTYLNANNADYAFTASSKGSGGLVTTDFSVVLTEPLNAGDVVDIMVYPSYQTWGTSGGGFHSTTTSALNNATLTGITRADQLGVALAAGASPQYTLDVNGTIYASGDVLAFSDARYKFDLRPLDAALERVRSLHGYTFLRRPMETPDQGLDQATMSSTWAPPRRHVGLLAQEVQNALPEAVYQDADGMLSVAYGNIVALLVEAMKEMDARMQSLVTRMQSTDVHGQSMSDTVSKLVEWAANKERYFPTPQ